MQTIHTKTPTNFGRFNGAKFKTNILSKNENKQLCKDAVNSIANFLLTKSSKFQNLCQENDVKLILHCNTYKPIKHSPIDTINSTIYECTLDIIVKKIPTNKSYIKKLLTNLKQPKEKIPIKSINTNLDKSLKNFYEIFRKENWID